MFWWTLLTVIASGLMFAIKPDAPYFLWGLVLLAVGTIFIEFASVSYNALLNGISNPSNVGRISGFGWAMGYFGGIVLLLICLLLFIGLSGPTGMLGISTDEALNVRTIMIMCAVWFAVFAIPTVLWVPEPIGGKAKERVSIAESYRRLFATVKRMWREDRNTLKFLLASALFRDGLNAIFSFGAVLAVTVYAIDDNASGTNVILFAIAANITSAIGALVAGVLEDRVGPKRIIMISLASLMVCGIILLFSYGPMMFWIFGLLLTFFVGPAQSSSRTFMARVATAGHEGEAFGLYATTGRAASWLAPSLFAVFSAIFGAARAGIAGILLVLLVGAIALVFVTSPARQDHVGLGADHE